MASVAELFRLEGKVAVVVGGARHLGFDMAAALAEAGSRVVVTSRTKAAAEDAAARLAASHAVETMGVALDHRRPESVTETFAAIAAWRGPIDILLNNAGGGSGRKPGAWRCRCRRAAAR